MEGLFVLVSLSAHIVRLQEPLFRRILRSDCILGKLALRRANLSHRCHDLMISFTVQASIEDAAFGRQDPHPTAILRARLRFCLFARHLWEIARKRRRHQSHVYAKRVGSEVVAELVFVDQRVLYARTSWIK